jgi:hypothetical protein
MSVGEWASAMNRHVAQWVAPRFPFVTTRLETERPAEQDFRSSDEPFVGYSSLKAQRKVCP